VHLKSDEENEIAAARASAQTTRRPTVPALEEVLFQALPVLDHGFIRVIDYMGDDSAVVQAARVSYGRGTRKATEDRGLIRYLLNHQHTTPFEMAEIKLHVKLPIFVARQWIRHRTANVNEYSARYSILDREFYLPEPDKLAGQSKSNRQGRDIPLPAEQAQEIIRLLRSDAENCYEHYVWMLNESPEGKTTDDHRVGLARELARMNLTLNTYIQWYWKIDLHNLLRFLNLRGDRHAQYEIRAYADTISTIVQRWVPITYEAFLEYNVGALTLSRSAVLVVKRLLSGENVSAANSGLSAREWRELCETLSLDK
jgi:thymidylate synthase (FAD)